MNKDYKKLFEEAEKAIGLQAKIIKNHETQITVLNKQLSALQKKYDDLMILHDKTCNLVEEQQKLLDAVFENKED